MIKGWSNAIRSLMARNHYDTSTVGYCKRARNCSFALRSLGASQDEINEIIESYDTISGIPPILLLEPYWRILLGCPSLDLFRRVIPLSNLGRACPPADRVKCEESEIKFFETTGRIPEFQFDLTHVGSEYGKLCRGCPPQSRIQINSHASYSFPRGFGGKWGEFCHHVIDGYLPQVVGDLVPTRPSADLFDCLGHVVLLASDWDPAAPITDVMYPHLGGSGGVDRRLGHFSLDWAIRSLHSEFPDCVMSDAPFLTFGPFIPNLCFDGTLPSRVSTLAEEGFKARVITIVKLSVSIIECVARYFLDPPMRTEVNVKIGLLSKVKLYDFLVHLNAGQRQGVVSYQRPSVFLRTALSADLTTATDTPYRNAPLSLLRGFVREISTSRHLRFLEFAIEVGCSPRGFESRFRPPDYVHRCGIMMGEGLSGTYLNVNSAVVRAVLHDFMDQFDFYHGFSVQDARTFVLGHQEMIQDYLWTVDLSSFGDNSTQSGDDLVEFSHSDPAEVRRYLILLYVIFGNEPSENTFYSSESYATFTEEAAIRHRETLGWVFIDCIKPRLYSFTSEEGVSPILSHISQITRSLAYMDDEDYVLRVCDVVDAIIENNRQIRDRMNRYHLVPGFPPELGGLDHPIQLIDGMEVDVPLEDRSMVVKLLTCTMEELWEVKYSWASEDLPDDDDAREIREVLTYV
jgi:hypothetical protein